MSRYLLLFLLNLPFIVASMLNATVAYKLNRISKRTYILRMGLWTVVLTGLALAYPIYNFLFTRELTESEPLSLFDVVQITALVGIFFIASRTRAKLEILEKRVSDLHQELSIMVSKRK